MKVIIPIIVGIVVAVTAIKLHEAYGVPLPLGCILLFACCLGGASAVWSNE